MAIEFQVDSLDTVDESLKSVYVEREGKFHFDADKYAEHKAQGLKNKNKEILNKLTEAKNGLKRFEKLAELEDDDIAELLELREKKGQQPPPSDTNNDELKAQLEKLHKKALDKVTGEKTTIETRAAELEKELKHYKLTVPIRDVALKAGVIPEDLDLVLLDTQKRFSLNDEGKIVVLDEDGDETDITPQKFFESLYKEMRPKFYAASGAGGSGAPAGTQSKNGTKVMRRSDFDKLTLSNPAQAQAFVKEVSAGKASLVD